jgi:hypothetical protein
MSRRHTGAFPSEEEGGTPTAMDRLDAETWCDECGEIGWEGTCDACLQFAAELDAAAAEAA